MSGSQPHTTGGQAAVDRLERGSSGGKDEEYEPELPYQQGVSYDGIKRTTVESVNGEIEISIENPVRVGKCTTSQTFHTRVCRDVERSDPDRVIRLSEPEYRYYMTPDDHTEGFTECLHCKNKRDTPAESSDTKAVDDHTSGDKGDSETDDLEPLHERLDARNDTGDIDRSDIAPTEHDAIEGESRSSTVSGEK